MRGERIKAHSRVERPMATDTQARSLESITDRLARLEDTAADIKASMATAADIEGVKTLIAQVEARQTKWLVGLVAAVSVSLAVAVIRTSAG